MNNIFNNKGIPMYYYVHINSLLMTGRDKDRTIPSLAG